MCRSQPGLRASLLDPPAPGLVQGGHEVVYQRIAMRMGDLGHAHVARGGFEIRMAELLAQGIEIETGFDEVGGVAVTQRVNRDTLMDVAVSAHTFEGTL